MATADRVLSVLKLFTTEQPEWTVDAIGAALGLSSSTAYQYVGSLVQAGLLVARKSSQYTVGPAAIELDRIARQVDPLTRHGGTILRDLVAASGEPCIGLLCRLYQLRVMCVDQHAETLPPLQISYERGRPMPLIRGSASKVILANLPARPLRRFYDREAQAVAAAGLGHDWAAFREAMKGIRKGGVLAVTGELDIGAMGISAPVFGEDALILGSIGMVLQAQAATADPARLTGLRLLVGQAGRALTAALRG